MSREPLTSEITFAGQPAVLACDGACDKAFGLDERPFVERSLMEDDWEYLADGELPQADEVSLMTEDDQDKPQNRAEVHNKWCARQCERSVLLKPGETVVLPDFSQRLPNIPEEERLQALPMATQTKF